MEDLQVKNVVKNHKLAQSISDCSWSEFTRQLQYKADWYSKTIVKIDRFYPSSKTCSCCGYKFDNLTLDIREWDCPECNTHHDRDINAAINILNEGLELLENKQVKYRRNYGNIHLWSVCKTQWSINFGVQRTQKQESHKIQLMGSSTIK